MSDYSELRRLADRQWEEDGDGWPSSEGGYFDVRAGDAGKDHSEGRLFDYLAALKPEVVCDLIDELAALREELDNHRLASAQRIERCAAREDELEQRLTAAEQRNAELVELLRDAYKFPLEHACATGSWPAQELCERIDAALKPTESGASDASKPPVGSVVIVCGGIKATVKAHHPDGLVVGAGDGYIVNEWSKP